MKTTSAITRRACLTVLGSAASLPLLARAAYQADGPALQRPLAAQSLATDIVLAGHRLVAVGERGHVLLSDDEGKAWRQAQAVPTRSTLTAVFAADERTLWAVGHGGIVLRSIDAGERWTLVAGQPEGREVLLSIRIGPDGRGLAVGGFGYALRTADGGAHWERATLVEGDAGERHLNRIFLSPAGTWLVAAEGGLVLRGEERGQRWQAVKTPYAGSLWSGAALGQGVLLACGMRGNIVRSSDDGRSWSAAQVPGLGSLTAVAPLPDGRCVLAGVDGGFAVGSAGGERFTAHPLPDRSTLTGLAVLSARRLVASGAQGMRGIDIPA
jgi:photosystem II stability/assembly factor-like uncharacterized protein